MLGILSELAGRHSHYVVFIIPHAGGWEIEAIFSGLFYLEIFRPASFEKMISASLCSSGYSSGREDFEPS
jgi:hypothetical protein